MGTYCILSRLHYQEFVTTIVWHIPQVMSQLIANTHLKLLLCKLHSPAEALACHHNDIHEVLAINHDVTQGITFICALFTILVLFGLWDCIPIIIYYTFVDSSLQCHIVMTTIHNVN